MGRDEIMGQVSITNSIAKVMKMYTDNGMKRETNARLYKVLMSVIVDTKEDIEDLKKKNGKKKEDIGDIRANTRNDVYDILVSMQIGIAGVGREDIIEFNEHLARFMLILQKKIQYSNEYAYNIDYINFERFRLLKHFLTCFGIVQDRYSRLLDDAFLRTYEYIHDSIKIYNRLDPEEFGNIFGELKESLKQDKGKKEKMEVIG